METKSESLRADAASRSWYCPGAGFALLGRDRLAIATYLVSVGALGALAWLIIAPGAPALWAALVSICASGGLWMGEQVACRKLTPRAPQPRILVGGFRAAGMIGWLGAAAVVVLLLALVGAAQVAGDGMSPTLEKGERLLYEKRVKRAHLRRGAVIIYRLSERSEWGKPGALMTSRILAVPGDELSIREGKYLVNGQERQSVAPIGSHSRVIPVPSAPSAITIPRDHFFVIQDSPNHGLDSRVLSWVERDEIDGARLYLMSGRGIFKPVQ
jgi:signal peptidase I